MAGGLAVAVPASTVSGRAATRSPRPAAWYAAQVPSLETMGAPSGRWGEHSTPYAVQSSGVRVPCRISPEMQAGCSFVAMSPTSNRRSASNRAKASFR